MMAQYCIGEVDAATIRVKLAKPSSSRGRDTKPKAATTSVWLTVLQLAAPLLLVVMAFALQNFARTKTG
jgi:hypothetical protein